MVHDVAVLVFQLYLDLKHFRHLSVQADDGLENQRQPTFVHCLTEFGAADLGTLDSRFGVIGAVANMNVVTTHTKSH